MVAGFATIALTVPVAAVIFTNSEIDLAETWSLYVLWSAIAIIGWTVGLHLLSKGHH